MRTGLFLLSVFFFSLHRSCRPALLLDLSDRHNYRGRAFPGCVAPDSSRQHVA